MFCTGNCGSAVMERVDVTTAAFGITIMNVHRAGSDAAAAAELLIGYLTLDPGAVHCDGLVAVAAELGINRTAAQQLHACYVRQLAHAA